MLTRLAVVRVATARWGKCEVFRDDETPASCLGPSEDDPPRPSAEEVLLLDAWDPVATQCSFVRTKVDSLYGHCDRS